MLSTLSFAICKAETPLEARAASFVSFYGLDPSSTPSITTGLCSTNPPIVLSTNDVTIMLLWKPNVIEEYQSGSFNRIRVVCTQGATSPFSIGDAYLFQSGTNNLAMLASPLVNTSMPTELLESVYRYEPNIPDVCFLEFGEETNNPPEQVFLVRNGVSCYLAAHNATNLVEIAEIVCDTLSPPAEASP